MQTSRLLPAVVFLALCAQPFFAYADDNPDQAAARAAMQEKMNELNNTNSPMTPPEQPETPPPVSATTPAPAPELPETPPVTAPPASSTPQMTVSPQLAEPASTNAAANASSNSAVPQYPVNPAPTSSQNGSAPITVPPLEKDTTPVVAPTVVGPTVAATPAASGQTNMPVAPPLPSQPANSSEAQITAPPLPITAEKQAELNDLLSRYMADQITAGQYQNERAKIMAQP